MSERIDVLAVIEAQCRKWGDHPNANELMKARAAVAELIEAASRHVHAVDHPAMDGNDDERQARTLRTLSAALARVGSP